MRNASPPDQDTEAFLGEIRERLRLWAREQAKPTQAKAMLDLSERITDKLWRERHQGAA